MQDKTRVKSRSRLPLNTEAEVLLSFRRRCAICFGLDRDDSIKRGQIAHLNRDRSNNKPENLVFLCLEHHDQYDSRTSQSKGFKSTEVKCYQAELKEALRCTLLAPVEFYQDQAAIKEWEGLFRWETSNAFAELRIVWSGRDRYRVSGLALWGTQTLEAPHDGVLDAAAMLEGDHLVLTDQDYELSMELTRAGLRAAPEPIAASNLFGMNVTFEGQYRRLPTVGEALPQLEIRPFESEFWPEEGIPVFEAKVDRLVLLARPSSDAPVVGYLSTVPGLRIPFSGFRYRTLRPGRIVVHEEYTLTGRNLGQTDYVSRSNYYDDGGEPIALRLQPNDRLEYLQYRAEGTGFIRWQGLVLDVEYLPWLESNLPLELIVGPVTEAWIRIESESDVGTGWILVNDEETLSEIDREFGVAPPPST